MVSSIPLQALSALLYPGDAAAADEASQLRLRDLALVFLILKQPRVSDDHWIFFPERQYPFNRMFEQKAMDPGLGPADRTAICCDLTCDHGDAVWSAPDDQLTSERSTPRAPREDAPVVEQCERCLVADIDGRPARLLRTDPNHHAAASPVGRAGQFGREQHGSITNGIQDLVE